MYKIQHFDRRLCEGEAKCSEDCDVYSIWRFCPRRRWQSLKEFLLPTHVVACQAEWFPFIYWIVLAISIMGILYSCSELLSIYYGSWKLSTFRKREFRVLPLVFRRNVRLISAALMIRTWTYLIYGMVTVSPSAITIFLTIYFAIFCLEFILWIGEILFSKIEIDRTSVWSHFVSLVTLILVRCVRDVFIRIIERSADVEEVQLLPILARGW